MLTKFFIKTNVSQFIPWGFLPNDGTSEFRVIVAGMEVATVTRLKVKIVEECTFNAHRFEGPGWQHLLKVENIVPVTRMVFTKLVNNSLSLMIFDGNRLGKSEEFVERMVLNELKPFVKSPLEKKGMLHSVNSV